MSAVKFSQFMVMISSKLFGTFTETVQVPTPHLGRKFSHTDQIQELLTLYFPDMAIAIVKDKPFMLDL